MFNSGRRGKRAGDGSGILSVGTHFNQQESPIPTITGYSVAGDSDYEADDLAVDTAGGQTITLNGNNFKSGAIVSLGGSTIGQVTVTSTTISFTAPAKTAGTYSVYVTNPGGGTAVLTPGVVYSGDPTWVSPAAGAELGPYYETTSYLDSFEATNPQDSNSSIVYSLYDGNFPAGATLDSNAGTLSGTAPVDGSSTTYSFTIKATDSDLQDTLRSFTLTINTDVVTWSAPGTSQSLSANAAMTPLTLSASSAAGYGVSYAADSLPTGLTLANDSISGTPTVSGSQYTTLTATAATTSRTATRTITWTIEISFDEKAYADVLIVQGDNVPVNADASSEDHELTKSGSPKATGWSPFLGKTYGLEMTDGYLQTADLGAGSAPGTGDFCLQLWYKCLSTGSNAACINYSGYGGNGFLLRVASGNFTLYMHTTLTFNIASAFTVGKWHHVVLARDGTSLSAWIDGTRIGNTTNSTDLTPSSGNRIFTYSASWHATNEKGSGIFSNVRWDVGDPIFDTTATSITVPTEPLTTTAYTKYLSDQSPYAIDNSSTAVDVRDTIVGTPMVIGTGLFDTPTASVDYGSMYFASTSDYYTYAPGGDDAFGTGDFTVECWFNPVSTTAGNISMASSNTNSWNILTYNNQLYWQENGSNLGGSGYGTVELNAWSHLVVCRSSGTLKMFINGVQVYSQSNTFNYSGTPSTRSIGPNAGGSAPYYLSNFRIVNGTALYTSAFTPPTAPLSAVTNTKLLTAQTNGEITNNISNLVGPISSVTYTAGGTPRMVSKTPYSPYGFSAYFDGTGDYLVTPTPSDTTTFTQLNSSDFTIEAWVYLEATNDGEDGIVTLTHTTSQAGAQSISLFYDGSKFAFWVAGNGGKVQSTTSPVANRWYHVALVREQSTNTNRLYIDGTFESSNQVTPTNNTSAVVGVGRLYNDATSYTWRGYISNLRISKVRRYTGNFDVPTTSLVSDSDTLFLSCQDAYFVDNGEQQLSFTSYGTPYIENFSPFGAHSVAPDSHSVYFDGTGDYLTIPASDDFVFGSGDFTVEAWIYPTTSGTERGIVNNWQGGGAFIFRLTSANKLNILYHTGSTIQKTSTDTVSANEWTHVALVRYSNNIYFYINGVADSGGAQSETGTIAYYNGAAKDLKIGTSGDTGNQWNGYISNLRIVKGSALYTTGFTPSTTALTTTSQGATSSEVKSLTCQSSTLIDNSNNSFAITSYGDTKPVEFNPFGFTSTTTDIAYDPNIHGGSFLSDNDYVKHATDGYGLMPGRDDFTMQLWWYYSGTSAPGDSRLMDITGSSSRLLIYYNSSSLQFYSNGSARITYSWNPASLKGWHHIAVSRVNDITRMFLNGVQVGNNYSDTNNYSDDDVNYDFFVDNTTQKGVGWIADATVHHTGLYAGNFVPPKRLVYLDYNNKLAASAAFNSVGIFDKTTTGQVELYGNTKISSFSKYGTGSLYFADHTDYALLESSSTLWDLKGDFTIEAWIYPTNDATQTWGIVDARQSGASATDWIFGLRKVSGNYKLSFFYGSTLNASTTINLNEWTHVAISRVNSDLSMYVNGTRDYNASNSTQFTPNLPTQPKIGTDKDVSNGVYETNGYIDDLRITNGEGRYTGTTISVPGIIK